VRTPMQWSSNRNADFSTAEPEQLYLPVVNDPIYGHQVVNVAAQAKTPSSLLNTMKSLIAARRQSRAFGRGTIEFLHPRNQAILAFLRRWEDETVLVVANLAGTTQPVELDLAAHGGAVPIELLGQTRFPPISDRPYFLSLGPHGFYWFRLEPRERGPVRYGIEATAI
jgi:maltose alpha-D-glucosyltransferase/alpha-amylase